MDIESSISVAVKILSNQFHRYMHTKVDIVPKIRALGHITEVQGHVVDFIANRREPAYQKDVEKHLSVRRSTASLILQRMEKAGLVRREISCDDARKKAILLTPKAKKLHPKAKAEIINAEKQARKGLTEEELATFFRVIEKISNNIR